MRNMLYVRQATTNAAAFSGDNIRFVRATSATNVEFSFIGDDGGVGTFDLTVTSGKADEIIKELCRVAANGIGLVEIGDEVDGRYFNSDVSAVAALAISA